MFKSFDYRCLQCNYELRDEVVEVIDDVVEDVICPYCQAKMEKQVSVPHFQFGVTYFNGMGPRRVEVQYCDEDGRVLKQENISHKVPTDC